MVAGKRMTFQGSASQALTRNRVVSMVGHLEDAKIAAILATRATVRDLEEAIAWARAESDVMGELEKRLDEPAAQVYRILMTSEEPEPDRAR
jgi:transposase